MSFRSYNFDGFCIRQFHFRTHRVLSEKAI